MIYIMVLFIETVIMAIILSFFLNEFFGGDGKTIVFDEDGFRREHKIFPYDRLGMDLRNK